MEESFLLVKGFFERRKQRISDTNTTIKNNKACYLEYKNETRRILAVILSKLFLLKFNLENGVSLAECEILKKNIHSKFQTFNKRVDSKFYCVYRSPKRDSIDMASIKVLTETPISTLIEIVNGSTLFKLNNKTIHGVKKHENIDLTIDEHTTVRIPGSFLQLPGDSISIEYIDVFYCRQLDGSFSGYKYKGLDAGLITKFDRLLHRNLCVDVVIQTIDIGLQILNCRDKGCVKK